MGREGVARHRGGRGASVTGRNPRRTAWWLAGALVRSTLLGGGALVAGCPLVAPPPVAVGPCALAVRTDEGGTVHDLQAPYAVTLLPPDQANESGQTGIGSAIVPAIDMTQPS